jgi:hypothetical protein
MYHTLQISTFRMTIITIYYPPGAVSRHLPVGDPCLSLIHRPRDNSNEKPGFPIPIGKPDFQKPQVMVALMPVSADRRRA